MNSTTLPAETDKLIRAIPGAEANPIYEELDNLARLVWDGTDLPTTSVDAFIDEAISRFYNKREDHQAAQRLFLKDFFPYYRDRN